MFVQERLIQGDYAALERVYTHHFSRVYGFCLKLVGDETLAADLVQEVFLKLWRNRSSVDPDLPIEQQLFVISRNLVLDHFRKKAAEAKMLAQYKVQLSQSQLEETAEKDQRLQKIRELVKQLPEKQRQVVELARYRGLTYEEIGEELNISPKTVSNHFTAAMKFLRQQLQLVGWGILGLLGIFQGY